MNTFDRETFAHQVLRISHGDYDIDILELLEYVDIEDLFSMDFVKLLINGKVEEIMKLCIETVHPEILHVRDGTPYALLKVIKSEKKFHDMVAHGIKHDKNAIQSRVQLTLEKGNFNGEMYYLTRSDKCKDPEYILTLFCNEPARKIQRVWKKYIGYKRDKSARIIQYKVLEWIYRPGGPIAKKAEIHFNSLI